MRPGSRIAPRLLVDARMAVQAGQVVGQGQRHAQAGTPLRAVMLDRLGRNVWHDSPAQAMAVLEELEETARLWHLGQATAPSLDAAALADLREAFGAAW